MHRTTVMLPRELHDRASRRARQRRISLGELIREALAAALRESDQVRESDPLYGDDAVFDGRAPSDLAARHDAYLYDRER
jgi:hypothetical protein